jgi:hypothetical protein
MLGRVIASCTRLALVGILLTMCAGVMTAGSPLVHAAAPGDGPEARHHTFDPRIRGGRIWYGLYAVMVRPSWLT